MSLPFRYEPQADELLYHYTSFTNAKKILDSGTMWLSDFKMMNDFTEFNHAKVKFLKHLGDCTGSGGLAIKFLLSDAINSITKYCTMLIASFSSEADDLGQWRAYADDAKGCVIAFNAKELEQRCGIALRRVVYDDGVIADFAKLSFEVIRDGLMSDDPDKEGLREFAQQVAADLFAFKNPMFATEKEIRISRLTIFDSSSIGSHHTSVGYTAQGILLENLPVKIRNGPYGSTPYVELPFSKFAPKCVKSIGFGPRATQSSIDDMVQFLKTRIHPLPHWKSEIPLR